MIVITSDTMGRGSEEPGGRLIVTFTHQLVGLPPHPDGLVFCNAGVRLLAPGSVVLDTLQQLEHAAVELLACSTCVEHCGLVGQTGAGRITDMREIVATLTSAERVVTI